MENCLVVKDRISDEQKETTPDQLIDPIRQKTELSKAEERVLTRLSGLSDRGFQVRFGLAWIIYAIVFATAGLLFYFIPEDRFILQFYLFAASGPLIMFTQRFSEYRIFRWLNKVGVAVMVLISIRIFLNWHTNHYTLYLLILVGMGPVMLILGTFYERRLLKIIKRLAV